MSCFQVRTDLALEARESIGRAEEELPGIRVEEYDREEIQVHVTKVVISSKNGAKAMKKPMGNYITLEAPDMQEADEAYHREISKELARQLKDIIPDADTEQSVLVVGLGNRDVTADALGNRAQMRVGSSGADDELIRNRGVFGHVETDNIGRLPVICDFRTDFSEFDGGKFREGLLLFLFSAHTSSSV